MPKTVTLRDIQDDYGALAEHYETRWRLIQNSTQDWILENWPENLPDNPAILDLGSGTGEILERLANEKNIGNITGIEGTSEMMVIAQSRLPEARFIEEDLNAFALDETFDVILSVNVLHHLNFAETHLENLKKQCKPGGTVFLCDFAIRSLPMFIAEHYWRLSHPSHQRAFTKRKLRQKINHHFCIEKEDILKPDIFWRLQIYKLTPRD